MPGFFISILFSIPDHTIDYFNDCFHKLMTSNAYFCISENHKN